MTAFKLSGERLTTPPPPGSVHLMRRAVRATWRPSAKIGIDHQQGATNAVTGSDLRLGLRVQRLPVGRTAAAEEAHEMRAGETNWRAGDGHVAKVP